MESLFSQTIIDEKTIILRLVVSLVLGGLIGLERESRRQQAGFRTHILICLGSTLLMLLSIYIPQTFHNFQNGDPGRIAAQVVTGIGFIGGGAIFKLGANVRGLTTAATIWVVAAIGLVVGAGMFTGGVIATIIILFVLIILDKVERKYFPETHINLLRLNFNSCEVQSGEIIAKLKKNKISIQTFSLHQQLAKQTTAISIHINTPVSLDLSHIYAELKTLDHITDIEISYGH